MFSNDCMIEQTFNYFSFLFEYFWFLELQFNWYKLLLFILYIIHQVFFFGFLVIIFASLIVDLFFGIDLISVHWSWNLSLGFLEKNLCGPYPNRTYGFSSPAGLWKVVARVTVGCSELFTSIDWFAWSKISFNFFVQAFFFLSLTCFYHLYWILVH